MLNLVVSLLPAIYLFYLSSKVTSCLLSNTMPCLTLVFGFVLLTSRLRVSLILIHKALNSTATAA